MQILFIGVQTGLIIAILALAFTVVHLPTRVFHVSLGGIYTLVPFVAAWALSYGLGWYLAIAFAIVAGTCVSLLCEYLNHAPLERAGASSGAQLVSSLGLYIVLTQAVSLLWGDEPRMLGATQPSAASFWIFSYTPSQLLILIVGILLLSIFYWWLHHSQLGICFRAMADNPVEVGLRGHSLKRLRLLAFGISGVLTSAVSLLVAYDIGFDPHGGLAALLLAVVASVIGGRSSFFGPLLGGLLLGLVRTEVVALESARWQEAVTFVVLGFFLYARPHGLLGRDLQT
jgi:branched-chain amino acid transport system permease protein